MTVAMSRTRGIVGRRQVVAWPPAACAASRGCDGHDARAGDHEVRHNLTEQPVPTPKHRFSGHETFPCRYAWLPKAYAALDEDASALADDEGAMVTLGLGKNMVRALRFWVQAMGVAQAGKNGDYVLTDFGRAIFAPHGLDPFLEDIRTLWLLHWHLSAQAEEPLFAWDYLLNRWQHPEITRDGVVSAFHRESEKLGQIFRW